MGCGPVRLWEKRKRRRVGPQGKKKRDGPGWLCTAAGLDISFEMR